MKISSLTGRDPVGVAGHRAIRVGRRLTLEINSPETIKRILDECHTIAVVGLSSSSWRPSHGVAAYMKRVGYRVVPVNPNETEVLGEKAYASMSSADPKKPAQPLMKPSQSARKQSGCRKA